MRYLLEHGWQVDGIDFVPQAVEQAQAKLTDYSAEKHTVYCHDVTRLKELTSLRAPYDLVIDTGCGHGILTDQAVQYARDVASLMASGGTWMLYAHQPSEDRTSGWRPEVIHHIFSASFELVWQMLSNDTTSGFPSGWYRLVKR